MRDILKFIGVGSLISLEKRKTKDGMDYLEGKLLSKTPSQMQITFVCFSKELCQSLLRENPVGERLKIQGSIKNHGVSQSISIYRLKKVETKYDKAEFFAIGTPRNITEHENVLNLAIETKTFYQGRIYLHSLDVKTYNSKNHIDKILKAKDRRVLAKGIIKEIPGDKGHTTICWLKSLDILQERVFEKEDRKGE